jgi:hypothetical protein
MSASHKRRLARLLAAMPPPDDAERRAVERREELRWDAKLCAFIRAAMERRGIDPASATALRAYEEKEVAGFIDTPELKAADEAFRTAHPEDADGEQGPEGDPREWVRTELKRIASRFTDGSSPDFACCSMSQLWGWAIAQARLARADREDPPPQAGEGSAA